MHEDFVLLKEPLARTGSCSRLITTTGSNLSFELPQRGLGDFADALCCDAFLAR
jgi:hypothetical protein